MNNLINSLLRKSQYYSSTIKENYGNQKHLFKAVQKLPQKPTVNNYPPFESNHILADEFATFFTTKIATLHNDLLVRKNALIVAGKCFTGEVLTMPLSKFSTFTEMKFDDIRELAATLLSKSCVLDHYHLLLSNCVLIRCCLLLIILSFSLFVKAVFPRV
mgnify:CR=1 FL=1